MRVQTEEWRRFIPGVRMYKGKKTLFYNGEKLWEGDEEGHPLTYDQEERWSWRVIIILPGVEIIPEQTFKFCWNVTTVIMSDFVHVIREGAFKECSGLKSVKLSRNLQYIGVDAFFSCTSLTSIFIPPSCTEIDGFAFWGCKKLLILGMPQQTQLNECVFKGTALINRSPIKTDDLDEEVEQWIRSINNGDAFALHRACASYNPLPVIIHDLVMRQGIKAMRMKNSIGITPSQYLEANTFTEILEKDIINRYISDMMGEVI